MRFYVIGGKKETIVVNTKKCLLNTTFYDDALQAFDVYATRMLFDNIYLVADFEMYNNDRGLIKHTISLDSDLEYVPFVILEEFHINDTPNRRNIVCNKIELKTEGFTQKFNNNIDAMNQFMYYYDKDIPCDMYVDGKKFASILDMMRSFDILHPIRKIEIKSDTHIAKMPA